MSIYINSNDYESGNSSNGIWNINRTLNGQYTLIGQHIEAQDFYWMWSGVNNIRLNFPLDNIPYRTLVTLDTSLCNTTNYSSIATLWQTNFQDALDQLNIDSGGDINVTCTLTYNSSGGYFNLVLSGNEGPGDGAILLFHDPLTTCGGVFGELNDLQDQNTFHLYTTYATTDPKYLEVYITESVSQYITTHLTSPTILFSTKDSEFTGQSFTIRKNETQLTIKIYRENIPTQTIPLTDEWSMILTQ